MAGGGEMLARLPRLLGNDVRVVASQCIGRCEARAGGRCGPEPRGAAHRDGHGSGRCGAMRHRRKVCATTSTMPPTEPQAVTPAARMHVPHRDAETSSACSKSRACRGLAAGAPAGRMWRNVVAEPGATDGRRHPRGRRPGAFKDRVLLERDPHRFLEGMLIAAWAWTSNRSTSICATSITLRERCWPTR